MSKLAINGGPKVFETPASIPKWPPVYPETAEKLKEIYLGHKWSFYGPQEILFNEKYAEYTGAKYCAMMANGTVTLELALQALEIGDGDEVIVPAHTWLATGEAVVYRRAVPVVVDIEPDTLCLDPNKIEAAITPKTKAIIPVHLFGSIADMDRILEIAKKHNLYVIEDCAHAHGGRWDGKHVGTLGNIGSFSFQESKILASGEGGACTTNDEHLAEILGRLSHIGYQYAAKQGQKGTPPPMGLLCHNYRVTDFQAAILLSQLEHLKEDTQLREESAEYMRKKLNAIPGITVQARGRKATTQSFYTYTMMVDNTHLKEGITKKEVCAAVSAEGAALWEGWGQPMYRQRLWSVKPEDYRIASNEVAEDIVMNKIMMTSLTWLMTSRADQDKYCDAVAKVMEEYYVD